MLNILKMLDGADGFTIDLSLNNEDLSLVRDLIRSQWLKRIDDYKSGLSCQFNSIEMDQYHTLCHLVDHNNMWPKSKRILSKDSLKKLRKTSLFLKLEDEFGKFVISGEDGIEIEEVYWRLVRPDNLNDVGPIHADKWFWDLGHGSTPSGHRRIKVWISIFSEIGKNGFKFIRGSHKKKWRYHGVERDSIIKPQIDEDISTLDAEIFKGHPGQAIIFHDSLLHGGEVGGTTTRVSLEFTMFVKNKN
jgi:hypothetical protein